MSRHEERIFGLDLIRILAVVAITFFHFNEAVFMSDQLVFTWENGFYYNLLASLSRTFTFAGFIIIALSSFLIGHSRMLFNIKKRALWLFLMLLFGAFFILPLIYGELENYYFEWDVYHLLLFSLIMLWLFRDLIATHYPVVLVLSLTLLSVPFHSFTKELDSTIVNQVLFGNCSVEQFGAWPILPWIGLVFGLYSLGLCFRVNELGLKSLGRWDWIGFVVLLGTLPWMGLYYSAPLGPSFYCFMNRQNPIVFLSHLSWLVFLIRISFLQSVNLWLRSNKVVLFISNMRWSKSFGWCYILQLLIVSTYSQFSEFFINHPTYAALAMASVMPLTECFARVIRYFKSQINK